MQMSLRDDLPMVIFILSNLTVDASKSFGRTMNVDIESVVSAIQDLRLAMIVSPGDDYNGAG